MNIQYVSNFIFSYVNKHVSLRILLSMADLLIYSRLFKNRNLMETMFSRESFLPNTVSVTAEVNEKKESTGFWWSFTYIVIILLLGGLAAWLSWDANSLVEYNVIWKVLFSFFAFLQGFSYLVIYLICKYDLVRRIKQ